MVPQQQQWWLALLQQQQQAGMTAAQVATTVWTQPQGLWSVGHLDFQPQQQQQHRVGPCMCLQDRLAHPLGWARDTAPPPGTLFLRLGRCMHKVHPHTPATALLWAPTVQMGPAVGL